MGKESTDGEVHEGAEASCGGVVRAVRSQRGVGDQRAGVSVPADAGALASGMGRGRPRRRRCVLAICVPHCEQCFSAG